MYSFSSFDPIIHIWSGEFINEAGTSYELPKKQLDHDFKLYIVRKGNFSFYVDNQLFNLKAGDCFLVPPFSKTGGIKKSKNALIFGWSHFLAKNMRLDKDNSLFIKGINEISTTGFSATLNDRIILPTKFNLKNPDYIYQLFRQLINLFSQKRYSNRSCDTMLTLFLSELSNDFLNGEALLNSNKSSSVIFIAEWIRVHLSDRLSVKGVAEHFELNPTYLTRKFHEYYGIGTKSYIVNQKIIHARYLLLTTNLSISDIAEQSFFESSKHFMKTFKQHSGITPTTYRKIYSGIHMTSKNIDPKPVIPQEFGTAALKKAIQDILNRKN